MLPWMIGAAMLRAGGEAWAKQLRTLQVLQEAAWRQTRVYWGLAHPAPVANICAPAGPARRTARRKPETEIEDVPV